MLSNRFLFFTAGTASALTLNRMESFTEEKQNEFVSADPDGEVRITLLDDEKSNRVVTPVTSNDSDDEQVPVSTVTVNGNSGGAVLKFKI